MSASPILELEKALPVIVDPLAIVSRPEPEPEPAAANEGSLQISVAEVLPADEPDAEVLPDALGAESAVAAAVALQATAAVDAGDDCDVEREITERSRITLPPARRRRRRRKSLAALLGIVVLGGLAGAAWYRYPVECEQGWQRARVELAVWQSTLAQQWAAGLRAIGH